MLVCACLVHKPPKTAFLTSRTSYNGTHLIQVKHTLYTQTLIFSEHKGLDLGMTLHLIPYFIGLDSRVHTGKIV